MSASSQKILRKLLPVLRNSIPGITLDAIKKKYYSLDQKQRSRFILEVKSLIAKNTL